MPFTLTLPDNYGYVATVALGAIPILSFIQGSVVGVIRKSAGVPYPNSYASAEQAKTNAAAYKFNCAQRAHANLLENMPQTIALLMYNGLFWPRATAAIGAGWVVFRAMFAYGYINSNKPAGRGRYAGSGFWLAQFGLIGMSIYASLQLI